MLKVKTITSKRQTDFENQVDRFLRSIWDSHDMYLENIYYAISADGKEIYRSAMVVYNEREENDEW